VIAVNSVNCYVCCFYLDIYEAAIQAGWPQTAVCEGHQGRISTLFPICMEVAEDGVVIEHNRATTSREVCTDVNVYCI